MESVLKTIAKQANLDRILFTPALKKMYFGMAVASGGATQFKHADSIRKGISFCADKADDKKHILLFCAVHELIHGYDLMIKYASEMLPIVVLATKSGAPETGSDNWSYMQLNHTGWIQFHTHTLQEVYDHLAMAYHLFEAHKVRIPILILQSSLSHNTLGSFEPHKDIDLGNPLTGLQTTRTSKKEDPFAAAFASMKKKKEPPTLSDSCVKVIPLIKQAYETFGYEVPGEGFPIGGSFQDEPAILSMLPVDDEADQDRVTRLLCYRPWAIDSLKESLLKKNRVVVVEPSLTPGSTLPFYSEVCSVLSDTKVKVDSVTFPASKTVLTGEDIREIEGMG
jgi:hypothetical protein